jgi:hypothetical protein
MFVAVRTGWAISPGLHRSQWTLNLGSLNRSHIRGTHVPVEKPSTVSKAELVGDTVGRPRKLKRCSVASLRSQSVLLPMAGQARRCHTMDYNNEELPYGNHLGIG